MEISALLKFKDPIDKSKFKDFASQNEIKPFRNTYYYNDVKIALSGKEITVSSDPSSLLSVAYISKKILRRFDGKYVCSPELSLYMPPSLFQKNNA